MMAGIGLNDKGDEENIRSDEDKTRMGHGCLKTHAKQMGKLWATVACFSAKQGLGIYIDKFKSVVIHCMLHRERVGGKEG
jgi:hypothetical protein